MSAPDIDVIAFGPADDPVLIKYYLAIWNGTTKEDNASDAPDAQSANLLRKDVLTEVIVDYRGHRWRRRRLGHGLSAALALRGGVENPKLDRAATSGPFTRSLLTEVEALAKLR